jgi:hypothetical protein
LEEKYWRINDKRVEEVEIKEENEDNQIIDLFYVRK